MPTDPTGPTWVGIYLNIFRNWHPMCLNLNMYCFKIVLIVIRKPFRKQGGALDNQCTHRVVVVTGEVLLRSDHQSAPKNKRANLLEPDMDCWWNCHGAYKLRVDSYSRLVLTTESNAPLFVRPSVRLSRNALPPSRATLPCRHQARRIPRNRARRDDLSPANTGANASSLISSRGGAIWLAE